MRMAKFKIKDVLSPYFSFKGRIGRGEFWAYGVALGVFVFLGALLARLLPPLGGELTVLTLSVLMAIAYGGLLVKRGHDRGRPAVFSIIVWVARLGASLAADLMGNTPVIMAVQFALILYVFIDYAVMPGKPGPNRFGPSPSGVGNKTPLVLGGETPAERSALPASPPNA